MKTAASLVAWWLMFAGPVAAAELADCLPFAEPVAASENADVDRDGVADATDHCVGTIDGASADVDAHGCAARFERAAGLVFDHDKHRIWYRRFWTGSCEGLGFWDFCQRDGSSWPKLSEETLDRVAPDARPRLRVQLWAMGRFIGYEWARDNDVRHIDTRALQRWTAALREADDVPAALVDICTQAVAAFP